jgi:Zn-dependent peptidase ImmA (M78 family)
VENIERGKYSNNLRDVLSDTLRKQDWYRDYLIECGREPLDFIGMFNIGTNVDEIANHISRTLKISIQNRKDITKDTFLKYLTEMAENAGIWVIRSGKVGSNTHRILDVEEFRGFALTDKIAPVVFVNAADAQAAQIFTLAHELAHLWIGVDGISNYSFDQSKNHSKVENLCNKVAGKLLVPDELLFKYWNEDESLQNNAEGLINIFKVSSVVIALRALNLRLTNSDEFNIYYRFLKKEWRKMKQRSSENSGGNFYNSLPVANGKLFTNSVIISVYSGKLLFRDGANLLGIKPSAMQNYARSCGII